MTNSKTASKTVVISSGESMPSADSISLQSLGAYMLFRPVTEETAEDLCEFIIKSNYIFPPDQPLTILINSPGGGVYDGFGIIDLIECSRLKIKTVAIGVVASMAAMIFTAGEKGTRTMSRNSFVMTHQFQNAFEGRYHEFVASRNHEDEIHRRFISHFLKHTKMSESQIKDVLLSTADRWIDAKEALKFGICDKIQDPWA